MHNLSGGGGNAPRCQQHQQRRRDQPVKAPAPPGWHRRTRGRRPWKRQPQTWRRGMVPPGGLAPGRRNGGGRGRERMMSNPSGTVVGGPIEREVVVCVHMCAFSVPCQLRACEPPDCVVCFVYVRGYVCAAAGEPRDGGRGIQGVVVAATRCGCLRFLPPPPPPPPPPLLPITVRGGGRAIRRGRWLLWGPLTRAACWAAGGGGGWPWGGAPAGWHGGAGRRGSGWRPAASRPGLGKSTAENRFARVDGSKFTMVANPPYLNTAVPRPPRPLPAVLANTTAACKRAASHQSARAGWPLAACLALALSWGPPGALLKSKHI